MTRLQSRMAELRQRFVAQTAALATEIEVMTGHSDWDGIRFACHGLAGRAGMFGFPELGVLASQTELAIDSGAAPAERNARVATLLEEMKIMSNGLSG